MGQQKYNVPPPTAQATTSTITTIIAIVDEATGFWAGIVMASLAGTNDGETLIVLVLVRVFVRVCVDVVDIVRVAVSDFDDVLDSLRDLVALLLADGVNDGDLDVDGMNPDGR